MEKITFFSILPLMHGCIFEKGEMPEEKKNKQTKQNKTLVILIYKLFKTNARQALPLILLLAVIVFYAFFAGNTCQCCCCSCFHFCSCFHTLKYIKEMNIFLFDFFCALFSKKYKPKFHTTDADACCVLTSLLHFFVVVGSYKQQKDPLLIYLENSTNFVSHPSVLVAQFPTVCLHLAQIIAEMFSFFLLIFLAAVSLCCIMSPFLHTTDCSCISATAIDAPAKNNVLPYLSRFLAFYGMLF